MLSSTTTIVRRVSSLLSRAGAPVNAVCACWYDLLRDSCQASAQNVGEPDADARSSRAASKDTSLNMNEDESSSRKREDSVLLPAPGKPHNTTRIECAWPIMVLLTD